MLTYTLISIYNYFIFLKNIFQSHYELDLACQGISIYIFYYYYFFFLVYHMYLYIICAFLNFSSLLFGQPSRVGGVLRCTYNTSCKFNTLIRFITVHAYTR